MLHFVLRTILSRTYCCCQVRLVLTVDVPMKQLFIDEDVSDIPDDSQRALMDDLGISKGTVSQTARERTPSTSRTDSEDIFVARLIYTLRIYLFFHICI